MELMEAIKGRRSIRKYKPDQVSEDDLQTILEASRWAPSWGNSQCWDFVVVRDPETKKKLSQTLDLANPAIEAIALAPIVLVACARLGLSGFRRGIRYGDKAEWFMFDVALALQNLTLTAHSLGLGTVHVGWFDAKKAAEILNVPEGVVVVELMPLGHPAEAPTTRPRKELKDIVFYEKYGVKKEGI